MKSISKRAKAGKQVATGRDRAGWPKRKPQLRDEAARGAKSGDGDFRCWREELL